MSAPKKKNTLLLVDPNQQRRNNLSTRFRLQGYDVELATSGFHCIHLVEDAKDRQKTYSLVLIVENMDDMPGREIIQLTRDINPLKDKYPILYMSSEKDPEEVLEFMNLGVNDFIVLTDNFKAILDKALKLAPLKK